MANPEAGANTVEDAVQFLSESRESEDQPEATEEQPRQANSEGELEAGAEAEEPKPEEPSEEGGDELEIPDNLTDFAEVLGVEPDELANHLRVSRRVNGKDELVPLSEVLKSSMMEADYRTKTSELAEQRRQFDAERQQIHSERQQKFERLDELISSLDSQLQSYSQADLNKILEEGDIPRYIAIKDQLQSQEKTLEKAKAEREKARVEAENEQRQNIQRYRAQQQQLLVQAIPDFQDKAKAAKLETAMVDALKHRGFSEEEIGGFFNGAFDHRVILLIKDAADKRALTKAGIPQKVKKLPKLIKSSSSEAKKVSNAQAIRDRFDKAQKAGARKSDLFALGAEYLASRRK